MSFIKTIESEIQNYLDRYQQILPDYEFSQYELVKDILMFQNGKYYSGNIDSVGDYKYWLDIIGPRVDTEIKNIDFDTKDIFLFSEVKNDSARIFLANSQLKRFLRDTKQAAKLNEIVEGYSGFGNVVLKKVKNDYVFWDPINFFVVNQAAKTLDETPVIERRVMTGSELQKFRGIWDDKVIDRTLENCGQKGKAIVKDQIKENLNTTFYEIYERNGEISLYDYKELEGKIPTEKDRYKYILAKIVVAGMSERKLVDGEKGEFLLYCDEMKKSPYREAHRGRYEGRWFRKGLYEVLMDIQIAVNMNVNEIRNALEFGAKQVFR